jgi:hypothetical protein
MTEQTIEHIVTELERTATELRSGTLDAGDAALKVDEVARLAAQAGTELDRRVRAGDQPLGAAAQLALGAQ